MTNLMSCTTSDIGQREAPVVLALADKAAGRGRGGPTRLAGSRPFARVWTVSAVCARRERMRPGEGSWVRAVIGFRDTFASFRSGRVGAFSETNTCPCCAVAARPSRRPEVPLTTVSSWSTASLHLLSPNRSRNPRSPQRQSDCPREARVSRDAGTRDQGCIDRSARWAGTRQACGSVR